jgi:hypothetical protein
MKGNILDKHRDQVSEADLYRRDQIISSACPARPRRNGLMDRHPFRIEPARRFRLIVVPVE